MSLNCFISHKFQVKSIQAKFLTGAFSLCPSRQQRAQLPAETLRAHSSVTILRSASDFCCLSGAMLWLNHGRVHSKWDLWKKAFIFHYLSNIKLCLKTWDLVMLIVIPRIQVLSQITSVIIYVPCCIQNSKKWMHLK